jgi:hypothetical protein
VVAATGARGDAVPVDPHDAGPASDAAIADARAHGLAGDGRTNDQPALAALVDRLGAAYARDHRPRVIYCPPGVYSIRDATTRWRSGVSLVGAGAGATRFELANPGARDDPTALANFTTQQHDAGRGNHLADCAFARFEIDGSGVRLDEYDPLAKGLGLQYVWRGRFRDLYIHDTAATGFGCDFLQDTVVEGVHAVRCGRLDNGEQMGGAGIGIGIGGWGLTERTTVTACTAVDNGTNGIFVELQRETWPPPRGIRITSCHAEGNRFGISDWGADGLVVSACTMTTNHEAGYDVSARGTAAIAGRGGVVTGCVMDCNIRDGVGVGNTPGPYTFTGNRISNNGRYGYWEHDVAADEGEPDGDVVLAGNDLWGNALDGIRVDGDLRDPALTSNRIRNNGRRSAPAASGGGDTVRYAACSVEDRAADWPADAHRGKRLRVGDRNAIVVANTATALTLAPHRPGADTAWQGPPPVPGTPYALPGTPEIRAGVTVNATVVSPTVHGNRCWDSQETKTQTHGVWITADGRCVDPRAHDNDLAGNAVADVAAAPES